MIPDVMQDMIGRLLNNKDSYSATGLENNNYVVTIAPNDGWGSDFALTPDGITYHILFLANLVLSDSDLDGLLEDE